MQVKRTTKINLSKSIKQIENVKAKVGFFSSAVYDDKEMKNGNIIKGLPVAQIAIQNEYGVPQKSIPPRPFMRPAVENNKDKWSQAFAKASKQSFISGDFKLPFRVVADTAVGDVKNSIKAVTTPALKASTVEARLRGKKQGKSVSLTVAKPLQDSGYLIDSVNREVT